MNHRLVAVYGSFEPAQILDVSTFHPEPHVVQMSSEMPLAAGREIVVDRDCCHLRGAQQPVHNIAPDKTRSAHAEEAFVLAPRAAPHTANEFSPNLCTQQ